MRRFTITTWQGAAAFAARLQDSVGDEPWFDYYRNMHPDYVNPPSAFTAFKLGSTAINIARDAWAMREHARQEWCERYGIDVSGWPVEHPPVVLWLPLVGQGACLACTWLHDRGDGRSDLKTAGREARGHSISEGADPAVVNGLGVPVVYREDGIPPSTTEV
jgi:hypothetical protein